MVPSSKFFVIFGGQIGTPFFNIFFVFSLRALFGRLANCRRSLRSSGSRFFCFSSVPSTPVRDSGGPQGRFQAPPRPLKQCSRAGKKSISHFSSVSVYFRPKRKNRRCARRFFCRKSVFLLPRKALGGPRKPQNSPGFPRHVKNGGPKNG